MIAIGQVTPLPPYKEVKNSRNPLNKNSRWSLRPGHFEEDKYFLLLPRIDPGPCSLWPSLYTVSKMVDVVSEYVKRVYLLVPRNLHLQKDLDLYVKFSPVVTTISLQLQSVI